jgi:hypothetical protein
MLNVRIDACFCGDTLSIQNWLFFVISDIEAFDLAWIENQFGILIQCPSWIAVKTYFKYTFPCTLSVYISGPVSVRCHLLRQNVSKWPPADPNTAGTQRDTTHRCRIHHTPIAFIGSASTYTFPKQISIPLLRRQQNNTVSGQKTV